MGMRAGLAAITASKLDTLQDNPDGLSEIVFAAATSRGAGTIDLDKNWHALHYLLTGAAWGGDPPLGLAILGGKDIGEDMGYGPARFVTPAQVVDVADALSTLTEDELTRRCDSTDMAAKRIYPTVWENATAEEFSYLVQSLRPLQQFYAKAAKDGDAVLQWIT